MVSGAKMVLATDLDGTFLGGTQADRARLYDWLRANAGDVALFFVTGRDPGAIAEICAPGFVPAPVFVIGDVGTTIATFDGATVRPIPLLEDEIATTWGDRAEALEAVMAREATRSTGIGSGIAIPHGKCGAVTELIMAIGIAREPIDFDSIDDKPVQIIVLLISPPDQTGPHIQALARISRIMLDEEFKQKLSSAQTAEQAFELLSTKEHE